MPNKKKNNVIKFPANPSKLERQVEAILFAASEPLDIETISYVQNSPKKEVGVEIHIGKNSTLKNLFAHLGYKIVRMDRVYFGGLTKKDIPRGRHRFLSDKEVTMLKMI